MADRDLQTALNFARLLNKARQFLLEYVNSCSACKDGKIVHADEQIAVEKGDPCPFCLKQRQFLEQCTKEAGPIVEGVS